MVAISLVFALAVTSVLSKENVLKFRLMNNWYF